MATDLTVKTLTASSITELGLEIASYLSGGGWNQADITAMEFEFQGAGYPYSCVIVHLTTPTP